MKFDITANLINRTLNFARTLLFGALLNNLSGGNTKEMLYLNLGALAIVELINDTSYNYLTAKSAYYKRFTGQALFEVILEKYKQIPIKYRNDPKFVEIERNLNLNSVSDFVDSFVRFFTAGYSVILTFLAITYIDFKLFFIAIFVGLLSFYFRAISQIRVFDSRDEYRYNDLALKRNEGNFKYNQVNSFSDNLIINNNFNFIFSRYNEKLKRFFDYNKDYYKNIEKIREYSTYLLDIAGTVTLVLVYLKGIDGLLPIGTLSILVSVYTSFTNNLASMGVIATSILNKFLEIKSISELLEYSIETKNLKNISKSKNLKIEFINVSFKYPDTEDYVLKNISITFEKGDKIGVIGQNGAGKSTLVKLLFRLYEPTEGIITINGENILNIKDEDYFNLLKILGQNQDMEEMLTIEELIYLGNTTKKMDPKLIRWAAKMAGADSFIEKLKDGYNQKISWGVNLLNKFSTTKYVSLSPGQERRIQIAKVFYSQKPIIILDEPTSNVDPIASKEVFENLNKLKKNEILILIAHDVLRLNNVANKIFVLKNGEIVEFGLREDLLKNPDSEYCRTLASYNSKNITVEKE